ncbi:hypothetical protein EDC94DRAFT_229267 [Helicostylum pulchrum]|nr:hypothetical protein EDC94DRAFT_229267 [Helicostylum pulchrum]
MEKVYDLRQHTHCVVMHIGKSDISTYILSTASRQLIPRHVDYDQYRTGSSISYNKKREDVIDIGSNCEEESEDNVVIGNFRDGLYSLFEKKKADWDKEDTFLTKAFLDYLPLALKRTMKGTKLEMESFDYFTTRLLFLLNGKRKLEMILFDQFLFDPVCYQMKIIKTGSYFSQI